MNILLITYILICAHFIYCAKEAKVDVEKYCKLECWTPGSVHTICKYKCEVSADCVNYHEYSMTDQHRQYILDAHNYYRNQVASGNDTRGGNGAAKNMLVLNYDKDIEISTSCWGKRCIFDHDECRQIPKYDSSGQNLFLQSSPYPVRALDRDLLNESVREWYEEIEYTNEDIITSFRPVPGKMIGHFTQIVWASTGFIGCSRVTFSNPNERTYKYSYHLLCNYSPAGNIVSYTVYEFGEGCDEPLKPNKKYPALCGELLPLAESQGGASKYKDKNKKEKDKIKRYHSKKEHTSNTVKNIYNIFVLFICQLTMIHA